MFVYIYRGAVLGLLLINMLLSFYIWPSGIDDHEQQILAWLEDAEIADINQSKDIEVIKNILSKNCF